MVNFAQRSPKQRFLIATETGILQRLNKEVPGKRFEAVRDDAGCRYVKMITLETVHAALRNWQYEVSVECQIAKRPAQAIERMVAIGP